MQVNHEKQHGYFPLNPGCLIKIQKSWSIKNPTQLDMISSPIYPKQPGFVSLLNWNIWLKTTCNWNKNHHDSNPVALRDLFEKNSASKQNAPESMGRIRLNQAGGEVVWRGFIMAPYKTQPFGSCQPSTFTTSFIPPKQNGSQSNDQKNLHQLWSPKKKFGPI